MDMSKAFDLTLEAGRSRGEFLRMLGPSIKSTAMKLLLSDEMSFVDNKTVGRYLIVTPHSLGFKGSTTRDGIYKCARQAGLGEVHPQAGPEFALSWFRPEAPRGEDVRIGMKPIKYNGMSVNIFEVRREQIPSSGVAKVTLAIDAGDSEVVFDEFSCWLFAII